MEETSRQGGGKRRIGICLCLLVFLLVLPLRMDIKGNSHIPGLGHVEEIARKHCAGQLPKVGAAFLFTRIVDGTLSLVEDLHIPVINAAPGKLLSGLHNSIRLLGDALLACTALLALGTTIMGMITFLCFKLLLPAALILRMIYECRRTTFAWAGGISRPLAAAAVLLWLFFPATALLNDYIQSAYLDDRITAQMRMLEEDKAGLDIMADKTRTDQDAGGSASFNPFALGEKISTAIKGKVAAVVDTASSIVTRLTEVVMMFALTTIVIPVFMLLIFVLVFRSVNAARCV